MDAPARILLIGQPTPNLEKISQRLSRWAARCDEAGGAAESRRLASERPYELAVADLASCWQDPAGLVEELLRRNPALPVALLGSRPDIAEALSMGRCGAADYLYYDGSEESWPPILARLTLAWEEGQRRQRTRPSPDDSFAGLEGGSRAMREAVEIARLIAPRNSTVLITGRTGVGKEVLARAIHAASPRGGRPLVAVNCGAIPLNLVETEFFGHVKGAFTGAVGQRIGRFEQAHRGTIFLDEVAELPLEMQAKLLRVLQEREFERVGGVETVKVDVRVIAATNRDLAGMVRRGEFREDLYYRLNVVPITVPSLAERIEDIPALAERLIERICRREGLPRKRAGREAVERLMSYDWPGNVRQLENAVDKAITLSGERGVLYPSDFPLPSAPLRPQEAPESPELRVPASGLDYDAFVSGIEYKLLAQALELAEGNKKRAAELLRIKRTTFQARWKALEGAAQFAIA